METYRQMAENWLCNNGCFKEQANKIGLLLVQYSWQPLFDNWETDKETGPDLLRSLAIEGAASAAVAWYVVNLPQAWNIPVLFGRADKSQVLSMLDVMGERNAVHEKALEIAYEFHRKTKVSLHDDKQQDTPKSKFATIDPDKIKAVLPPVDMFSKIAGDLSKIDDTLVISEDLIKEFTKAEEQIMTGPASQFILSSFANGTDINSLWKEFALVITSLKNKEFVSKALLRDLFNQLPSLNLDAESFAQVVLPSSYEDRLNATAELYKLYQSYAKSLAGNKSLLEESMSSGKHPQESLPILVEDNSQIEYRIWASLANYTGTEKDLEALSETEIDELIANTKFPETDYHTETASSEHVDQTIRNVADILSQQLEVALNENLPAIKITQKESPKLLVTLDEVQRIYNDMDKNSKVPISEIAKKLGLSPNVVKFKEIKWGEPYGMHKGAEILAQLYATVAPVLYQYLSENKVPDLHVLRAARDYEKLVTDVTKEEHSLTKERYLGVDYGSSDSDGDMISLLNQLAKIEHGLTNKFVGNSREEGVQHPSPVENNKQVRKMSAFTDDTNLQSGNKL